MDTLRSSSAVITPFQMRNIMHIIAARLIFRFASPCLHLQEIMRMFFRICSERNCKTSFNSSFFNISSMYTSISILKKLPLNSNENPHLTSQSLSLFIHSPIISKTMSIRFFSSPLVSVTISPNLNRSFEYLVQCLKLFSFIYPARINSTSWEYRSATLL